MPEPGDLRPLFDRLVPPDTVTVTDAAGGTHRLPGAIPAGRQIKVIRLMQEALATPAVQRAGLVVPTGAAGDDLVRALASLVVAVADEEVVEKLGAAFGIAFPDAVAAAGKAAGTPDAGAVDLFAVEELVAGLLPLSLRLLRRAMGLALAVQGAVAPAA